MGSQPMQIPLVFGTTSLHSKSVFNTKEAVDEVLQSVLAQGVRTLDTAKIYGDAETVLGTADVAGQGFTVDTKSPGCFVPGSLEPKTLEADLRGSVEKLGVKKLDVYYIHGPDPKYPIADTLEVLDRLHKEGLFARLGLSNFLADEVREACDVAAEKGYLAPTVYQGNYNAVARRAETELFPLLRQQGIAFYAYSPLAGGFLAKRNTEELFGKETGGRFAKDGQRSVGFYQTMYSERPKIVAALEKWNAVAAEEGCECPAELGYRWIAWNGALKAELGDKVIFGASRLTHVPQVVGWVKKGPLSEGAAKAIDDMWESIKDEAPLDNWHQ